MSTSAQPVSCFLKKNTGHVHLVGICGIGMAGLAFLLKARGFKVTGCDLSPNRMAEWLAANGIEVLSGHDPKHVEADVEWIIRSAAVSPECPEISHALQSGVPVFSRGMVLPELLAGHKSVAVGGTHGKTTTASFIIQLLKNASRDPSWCIGGETDVLGGVAGVGSAECGMRNAECGMEIRPSAFRNPKSEIRNIIVVEADESDGTLALYKPDIALVTNIEFDHMEHFENKKAFEECFRRFIENARRKVVFNADDPGAADVFGGEEKQNIQHRTSNIEHRTIRREQEKSGRFLSYGFLCAADIRGRDLRETGSSLSFVLEREGKELGRVELPVMGKHNAHNALAAIAVAFELGLSFEEIRTGLGQVSLPRRRFERILERNGILVVSDYAHHPSEISALVQTAANLKHKRLLAVFQPHRYTRTRALGPDFPPAFEGIDKLILTPVYPASEEPVRGGTVWDLYAKFRGSCETSWTTDDGRPTTDETKSQAANTEHRTSNIEHRSLQSVIAADSLEQAWEYLGRELREGDILLVVGAGDVEKVAIWARDFLQGSGLKDSSELTNCRINESTIRYNEPLAEKTTLKVGGKVDVWVEVGSLQDLKSLLAWSNEHQIPFHLLGGGSNVLISDLGVRGITARLAGDEFKQIREENVQPREAGQASNSSRLSGTSNIEHRSEHHEIAIGAGVTIARLLNRLEEHGWEGLEFLEGIPGTFGGALRMNAGASGHELGEYISWIRCLDMHGSERRIEKAALGLEYRRCACLENRVLVEAGLRLAGAATASQAGLAVKRGKPAEIRKRRADIAGRREWMRGMRSAGSVFKNPELRGESAGSLIEKAGLKGLSIGGARISTEHANFIVTEEGACASDVRALIELIRIQVAERFGIVLEEEIVFLGDQ